MREAVIVSTARTPIGRAFRGAFNNTHGAVMAGHAVRHAVERSGLDPAEIDDVIMGCGLPEGATAFESAAFPTLPLYRGNPWFLPLAMRYFAWKDARLARSRSAA